MKSKIYQAIQNHDELVIEFNYQDAKGVVTRRVVSPIRFLPQGRFLGLCLSREEPRQFYLARCESLELRRAENYLMPVPLAS